MNMIASYAGYAPESRQTHRNRTGMVYSPPRNIQTIELTELLAARGGVPLEPKQLDLMFGKSRELVRVLTKKINYVGDLSAITSPAVAIVGTRAVSSAGAARARKLARALAQANVAVVSGLAEGVDTAALTEAIACRGRVAAVIGTPLDKAYPAKNAALQEAIYNQHLLISQFEIGQRTFKSNFPERNRLMAAISDATVVIEASDTSGTIHQSAECQKLGRWLFIAKSVVDNPDLTWPKKFLPYEKCVVLERVEDVLDRICQ